MTSNIPVDRSFQLDEDGQTITVTLKHDGCLEFYVDMGEGPTIYLLDKESVETFQRELNRLLANY